jgi:hypothetical protein
VKRSLACLCAGLMTLSAIAGCGSDDNSPPKWTVDIASDRYEAVGVEFQIVLRAIDPDGDPVSFSYKADLGNISDRARIDNLGPGEGRFYWKPIASDVGIHALDLIASDGTDQTKQTVSVTIKPAVGSATSPVFRQPLGTGTTLDLAGGKTCVSVPIEIEDSDSPGITIGEEEPRIEGATLNQDGPMTGSWEWCPTQAQVDGGELYQLKLSADDGDNPKVTKDYVIVLKKGQKPNCPGEAPSITHTPADVTAIVDLTIDALVSDDKGLKFAPLLLYTTSNPGPNPDLAAMTQVSMIQIDGDLVNGTWAADVPNPVANSPAGTTATVYYLIIARDNDDELGDCDHVTQSPASGTYSMKVTNPGGAGGLAVCKPCTADVQCGGPDDNCLFIGAGSDTFCGKKCTSSADCPSGYDCSPSNVLSIDFKSSRQCIPKTQSCTATTTCTDDQYEENDTLSAAKLKPALPPGTYNLMSCPGPVYDDEDWYKIEVGANTEVTASINGTSSSDLDLFLKDSTGKVLASSAKTGSIESLTSQCLAAGTYYLHVYAWSQAKNPYTLSWSKKSCSVGCQDDSYEPDDNASQARTVNLNLGPYKALTNSICPYNEDWYEMQMYKDESIVSTLTFTQTGYTDEIDVYVYDSGGKNLTPCCDPNNGQSSTSNEKISYKILTSGTYFVVVKGYAGSANKYGICIDYQSTSHAAQCP